MPLNVETTASGIATRLSVEGRRSLHERRRGTNGPFLSSSALPVRGSNHHSPSIVGAPAPTATKENKTMVDQQKLDALVGRLIGEISAGYGGVMVGLGDKLGLYKAMAGAGPLNSQEVANREAARAHDYRPSKHFRPTGRQHDHLSVTRNRGELNICWAAANPTGSLKMTTTPIGARYKRSSRRDRCGQHLLSGVSVGRRKLMQLDDQDAPGPWPYPQRDRLGNPVFGATLPIERCRDARLHQPVAFEERQRVAWLIVQVTGGGSALHDIDPTVDAPLRDVRGFASSSKAIL